MHVKVKLAFEVMRPKLAKVGFIPYNDVGGAYFVETRIAREEGVDDGLEHVEVLVYKFFLSERVHCQMKLAAAVRRMRTREVGGGGGRCGSLPLPMRPTPGRCSLE